MFSFPASFSPAATSLSMFTLPQELGTVEEVYQGSDHRLVVFIQDAHVNLSAQQNIAQIIELLIQEHGFTLAGQEAGEGNVDTRLLRAFPVREIAKKVMERYLRRGEMGGPEYLAITGSKSFNFVGVDDQKLYVKNLKQFFAVLDQRPEGLTFAGEMRKTIKNLEDSSFSKPHRAFNETLRTYRDGHFELLPFLRFLYQQALERSIDIHEFPHIFRICEWTDESESEMNKINPSELNVEMQTLAFALKRSYAQTALEKRLLEMEEFLFLLERGLNLELTRKESERFKEIVQKLDAHDTDAFLMEESKKLRLKWNARFRFQDNVSKFSENIMSFYDTASRRDPYFVKQLLKKAREARAQKAILITGGFHREGIIKNLKEKNISHIVITPRISEIAEHGDYLKVMKKSRRLIDNPRRNAIGYRLGLVESNPDRALLLRDSLSRMARLSRDPVFWSSQSATVRAEFLTNLLKAGFGFVETGESGGLEILSTDDAFSAAEQWFRRVRQTGVFAKDDLRRLLVSAVHRFAAAGLPHELAKGFGSESPGFDSDTNAARDLLGLSGQAAREHRYDEALELARDAVRHDSQNPRAWETLIHRLFMAGRMLDVIAESNTALFIHPDNADILSHLARAYFSLGRFREAILTARQAMDKGASPHTRYSPRRIFSAVQEKRRFDNMFELLQERNLTIPQIRGRWMRRKGDEPAFFGVSLYDRNRDFESFQKDDRLQDFLDRALSRHSVLMVLRTPYHDGLEAAVTFRPVSRLERDELAAHTENSVIDGIVLEQLIVTNEDQYTGEDRDRILHLLLNILAQVSSDSPGIAQANHGVIVINPNLLTSLGMSIEEAREFLRDLGMLSYSFAGRKGTSLMRFYMLPEQSNYFQWKSSLEFRTPYIARTPTNFKLSSGYERFDLTLSEGNDLDGPVPVEIMAFPSSLKPHFEDKSLVLVRLPIRYRLKTKFANFATLAQSIFGVVSEQPHDDGETKLWIAHLNPGDTLRILPRNTDSKDQLSDIAHIRYLSRSGDGIQFNVQTPYPLEANTQTLEDLDLVSFFTVNMEPQALLEPAKDERHGTARMHTEALSVVLGQMLKDEKYSEMFPIARLAIELNPINPYGWSYLSRALRELGRLGTAIKLGRVALLRFPDNPAIRIGQAESYLRVGRPNDALAVLDFDKHPGLADHAPAYVVRANALARQEKSMAARDMLLAGQRRFPHDSEFSFQIDKLARTGRVGGTVPDSPAHTEGAGFGSIETFSWDRSIHETTDPDDFLFALMEKLEASDNPVRVLLFPVVIPFADSAKNAMMEKRIREWQTYGIEYDSDAARKIMARILERITQKKITFHQPPNAPRDRILEFSEPFEFYGKNVTQLQIRLNHGERLSHSETQFGNPGHHLDLQLLRSALFKHSILELPLTVPSDFQRDKLLRKISSGDEYKGRLATEEEVRSQSGFGAADIDVKMDRFGFQIHSNGKMSEMLLVGSHIPEAGKRSWDPGVALTQFNILRQQRRIMSAERFELQIVVLLEGNSRILLSRTGSVTNYDLILKAIFLERHGLTPLSIFAAASDYAGGNFAAIPEPLLSLLRDAHLPADRFSDTAFKFIQHLGDALRQQEIQWATTFIDANLSWLDIYAAGFHYAHIPFPEVHLDDRKLELIHAFLEQSTFARFRDQKTTDLFISRFLNRISLTMMTDVDLRKERSDGREHELRNRELKEETALRHIWRNGGARFDQNITVNTDETGFHVSNSNNPQAAHLSVNKKTLHARPWYPHRALAKMEQIRNGRGIIAIHEQPARALMLILDDETKIHLFASGQVFHSSILEAALFLRVKGASSDQMYNLIREAQYESPFKAKAFWRMLFEEGFFQKNESKEFLANLLEVTHALRQLEISAADGLSSLNMNASQVLSWSGKLQEDQINLNRPDEETKRLLAVLEAFDFFNASNPGILNHNHVMRIVAFLNQVSMVMMPDEEIERELQKKSISKLREINFRDELKVRKAWRQNGNGNGIAGFGFRGEYIFIEPSASDPTTPRRQPVRVPIPERVPAKPQPARRSPPAPSTPQTKPKPVPAPVGFGETGKDTAHQALSKIKGLGEQDITEIIESIDRHAGNSAPHAYMYIHAAVEALNAITGLTATDKKEILISIAQNAGDQIFAAWVTLKVALESLVFYQKRAAGSSRSTTRYFRGESVDMVEAMSRDRGLRGFISAIPGQESLVRALDESESLTAQDKKDIIIAIAQSAKGETWHVLGYLTTVQGAFRQMKGFAEAPDKRDIFLTVARLPWDKNFVKLFDRFLVAFGETSADKPFGERAKEAAGFKTRLSVGGKVRIGAQNILLRPTVDIERLADQIIEIKKRVGEEAVTELQLAVAGVKDTRARSIALGLFIASTDHAHFQGVIKNPERDTNSPKGLLIAGTDDSVNFKLALTETPGKRMDFLVPFPRGEFQDKAKLVPLIRFVKNLSYGLYLAEILQTGKREALNSEETAIANVYVRYERELVRILRKYEMYKDESNLVSAGFDDDHDERILAVRNHRLEEALWPQREWLVDLKEFHSYDGSKNDQSWSELVPFLRRVEFALLDREPFEDTNIPVAKQFLLDVRSLVFESAAQIENIQNGKTGINKDERLIQGRDPLIDPEDDLSTRLYASRVDSDLVRGRLEAAHVPDMPSIRYYAQSAGFGIEATHPSRVEKMENQVVELVLEKVRSKKMDIVNNARMELTKTAVLSDLDAVEKLEKALRSSDLEIRNTVRVQLSQVETVLLAWDTGKISLNEIDQLNKRIAAIFSKAARNKRILVAENDQKNALLREAYGATLLGELTQYLIDHIPPAVLESMETDYLASIGQALNAARLEQKLLSIAA